MTLTVTILYLKNNNVVDVSPLSGMTTMFVLEVAGNPISDYATLHTLKGSHSLWGLDISLNNTPPHVHRLWCHHHALGRGEHGSGTKTSELAVAATDANNHTLILYPPWWHGCGFVQHRFHLRANPNQSSTRL